MATTIENKSNSVEQQEEINLLRDHFKDDIRILSSIGQFSYILKIRANQYDVSLTLQLDATIKRYRGVISTMKDSFGFIEREDELKEIFFHITEFGPNIETNIIQPGVEVEFDIQDRHNKEVAINIVILPKGTVQFDEIDKTPYIGRILQTLQNKPKKSNETLTGRLLYDTIDNKMSELSFGKRDRCGLYTLLENDIVQFVIAKDKRDGMMRATQISLLDQSFLKSKEHREMGIVIKLDSSTGGQIKCLSSDQIISFRFTEVMKDNFQISEGDPLEFSLAMTSNNGDLPHAIRIKLLSKDSLLTMINDRELRLTGVIERDPQDGRIAERNNRGNDVQTITDNKVQQTQNNDSTSNSINRSQDSGIIRYICDGIESTIQFLSTNMNNVSTLYYGDKVEFTFTSNSKLATNVTLIERNRMRGWIVIIREGKGFIEQYNNKTINNIEPIAFTINSFTNDSTQIDLGDEVEFSLRKISGRLTAENIVKVPTTIQNLYSVLPTIHRGRVVSPVRMITNDDCEILGRIQKLNDDNIPCECYTYSITGVKNKRVILLPNDLVTFSVAVGLDYSTRAVNIILENEIRKGKIDTVKGQFGFIDFACEENKKIFFHNSEIDGGFELRLGDEVEFYAQYNLKSGKPCASKLRRVKIIIVGNCLCCCEYVEHFKDTQSLVDSIYINIQERRRLYITFDSWPNERSTLDLNLDTARFLWYKYYFNILSRLQNTSIARCEMLESVRAFHKKQIDTVKRTCEEFERIFVPKKSGCI
ncbi:unnamed protein product [Rotaria sp. Silwood1]|nr:unnamed protein product [Rotaria sp. Silwood1]